MAGYHAGIVIKNALFRLPTKANHPVVPWVTFTSPEVSHVGLNESQSRKSHGDKLRFLNGLMLKMTGPKPKVQQKV